MLNIVRIVLLFNRWKIIKNTLHIRCSQVSQRRQKKVDDNSSRNGEAGQNEGESGSEKKRSNASEFCYKCNIRVNLEDTTTFAICRGCDLTVCRSKLCSDWDRTTGHWDCVACISNRDGQVRAGEWILDQLNRRFKGAGAGAAANGGNAAPGTRDDTVASHRDVETRK